MCQWHANERRSHLPIRSVLPVCHWQTAPEPAGEKRRAGGTRMSAGLISRFGRCFLFATGKPHPSRQARLRGRHPLLCSAARGAVRHAKQKKTVPAKNSEAIFWRPRFTRPLRAGKRANANFACSEGVFLRPVRRSVCRGWPLLHELYELLSGFRARVSRRFFCKRRMCGYGSGNCLRGFLQACLFPRPACSLPLLCFGCRFARRAQSPSCRAGRLYSIIPTDAG